MLRPVLNGCPFSTGQPVPASLAGTNGGMRPVLMELFLVVCDGSQGRLMLNKEFSQAGEIQMQWLI